MLLGWLAPGQALPCRARAPFENVKRAPGRSLRLERRNLSHRPIFNPYARNGEEKVISVGRCRPRSVPARSRGDLRGAGAVALDGRRERIDEVVAARLGSLRLAIENCTTPTTAPPSCAAPRPSAPASRGHESSSRFRFSPTVTQGCEKWLDIVRQPTQAEASAACAAMVSRSTRPLPSARRPSTSSTCAAGGDPGRQRAGRPVHGGHKQPPTPAFASRWRA